MKEVVVVSGVRLPVGSYGGSLKDISAIDMGAMVVKEAVALLEQRHHREQL